MAQTETEGSKPKHRVSMLHEQAETSAAGQRRDTVSSAPGLALPPKQSSHRSTVCRYHQAGYCRHGDFCHFKHLPNNSPEKYSEYRKDSYTSIGISSLYVPSRSSFTPYHISPTWISFPPPYSGTIHLANQSLPPAIYSPGLNSPNPDVYAFSDASSSGTDEAMSPKTSRRSQNIRYRDCSYSQAAASLSPNIYFPFQFTVPENSPSYRNTPFIERRQNPDFKKKPIPYKTKACKFYKKNGSCPNGDKCTFIHNVTGHAKGPKNDKSNASATASGTQQDDPDVTLVDRDVPADLPAKPISVYEQYRKKGFYPVTWRVIGGGVMMGGKSKYVRHFLARNERWSRFLSGEPCKAYAAGHCKDGDDCRFTHDIDSLKKAEPPSLSGEPELDRSSHRKMVIGRTREPCLSNSTLDIYIPPQPLPMLRGPAVLPEFTGRLGRSKDDSSASKRHPADDKHEDEKKGDDTVISRRRRSRSMSIPSSPSLPRVSSLFSAEL